ncbi:hypothetical protein [Curtobacterium sp. VKM Ac-2922]|uniref:hypothetical protein n=1 Tax=Curtobacterium sp. VKM Ac-2922 TaxID=2929475 RepID=UPI001FB42DD4|nr:hypothetical protein [Curtobacterium sp. VKM Ac-2922]MCJ1715486.1 hypothetical protein [Curtobacterium sp. VKM Ac-2922]
MATTQRVVSGTAVAALLAAIQDRLRGGRYDDALAAVGDVGVLADRMVAALPAVKHEADALIGPFYDASSLASWRGVTRQAISKASTKGDLLGLKIGDGSRIFPSFQFGPSGAPLPHLRQVLALLDPDRIDPWGSALWLNTVADEFGGTTAAQALRAGRHDVVLRAARRAAHAWLADA